MNAALLLVDLQNDFLRTPGLDPPAEGVEARAVVLLEGCRRHRIPVLHVRTTVRDLDHAMPHWARRKLRMCLEGTEGHAFPLALRPAGGERTFDKTFFSAFANPALEEALRAARVDTVLLAGVHLHGCVRATALDAYQRGFAVLVAEDAVASHEPLHAASTRRWLDGRAARFLPVEELLNLVSGEAAAQSRPEPAEETRRAREAWPAWRAMAASERAAVLVRFAALVEADAAALASRMARETGKPVRYGLPEVARGAALLRAAARRASTADPASERARRRPHGVVALVTPWNSPVAIPLGKIGPALAFGNTAVWKPAPVVHALSSSLVERFREAGGPRGALGFLAGDAEAARALMEDPHVHAISLTGSSLAGAAAQEVAARRMIPLQAELGGNNAAIVWGDADLEMAARRIAEGAFGQAGQRCTANRRVVVEEACADAFLDRLVQATKSLVVGDPEDPATHVGPLVSAEAKARVEGVIARARRAFRTIVPHAGVAEGTFVLPTIVLCDDPQAEIVQEETFGPVIVAQRATSFPDALRLLNGVRQGLVAALFTASAERQASFLEEAEAGVLKFDRATADAGVEAPFGGWKASGVGPPEHGEGSVEFYTRQQALYG